MAPFTSKSSCAPGLARARRDLARALAAAVLVSAASAALAADTVPEQAAAEEGVSFFVGQSDWADWMGAPGQRFGVAESVDSGALAFPSRSELGFGREPEARANKLVGGFRFNQYFSVELGLAEFDAEARSRETHRWGSPIASESASTAPDADLTAMSASVTGALPLGRQVNVFGKAGLFRWEVDARRSETRIDDPDDSGYQLQLGIGSDFRLNDRLSFGAQWEYLGSLDRRADRTGEHLFSGRFRFEF